MSSEQFAEIVTAAIVKSSVPQGWDLNYIKLLRRYVMSFLLVFFEHGVSNVFHCRQAKSGEIIMSPKQPDELHSTILERSPRTRTSQVSWQNRRLFRGLFKLKISKNLKIPWSGWPRRRWYQKQIKSIRPLEAVKSLDPFLVETAPVLAGDPKVWVVASFRLNSAPDISGNLNFWKVHVQNVLRRLQ